ncbi:MAG: regulatory protein SipA [Cyanobacterium sp.]
MDNTLRVGDKVRVTKLPPYLKTAEPMPMLKSASEITIGEEGIILSPKPSGYWAIRFTQKAFLLESQYFEKVE